MLQLRLIPIKLGYLQHFIKYQNRDVKNVLTSHLNVNIVAGFCPAGHGHLTLVRSSIGHPGLWDDVGRMVFSGHGCVHFFIVQIKGDCAVQHEVCGLGELHNAFQFQLVPVPQFGGRQRVQINTVDCELLMQKIICN